MSMLRMRETPAVRKAEFLPGDLVLITLSPGDPCAEYSGRQGVITYGPDDDHVTGWQVSAMGRGLRCVASELTMITPREDR
jgi:hypothetical protein